MDKQITRQIILSKLQEQGDQTAIKKSRAISKRLFSLEDYSRAKTVFFYISKGKEVNTHEMIKHSLETGKCVYAPLVKNKKIVACKISDFGRLKKGTFGILEPPLTRQKSTFNIIIVPGLAFDKGGTRLGRGHGYFDRFLPETKGIRIGLAFDFQVVDSIRSDPHDAHVHKVITEKRVLDCSG